MGRDGALFHGRFSTRNLHEYAENWRVNPAQSIFPPEGRPLVSGATNSNAEGLPSKSAQDTARQACSRVGVTNAILLKDCILDVGVTGNDGLAEPYVYSPRPKRDATLH